MIFLQGVTLRRKKNGSRTSVRNAFLTKNGIVANSSPLSEVFGRERYVPIISWNQWRDACSDMGWLVDNHPWTQSGAWLCFHGVWFTDKDIGKRLHIGRSAILEIVRLNTPPKRVLALAPGFAEVLSIQTRAGVVGRVRGAGDITVFERVVWQD